MRIPYAAMLSGMLFYAAMTWDDHRPIVLIGEVGAALLFGAGIQGLYTVIRSRRKSAAATRSAKSEVTSEDDRNRASFEKGILPCCGGTEFYPGPEGGMCMNIKCANEACGQEWNVAFVNGVCMMADRIKGDVRLQSGG